MTSRADEFVDAVRAHAAAIDVPARDLEMLRSLATCAGWGARDVTAPLLPSGISHGVPWELSHVVGSRDLRVFVEAQSDPATPLRYWHTASRVTAFAATRGAHIDRLRAITGGFTQIEAPRPPRVWHAVALPFGTSNPRWHAYVTCPSTTAALAALDRIGVRFDVPLRAGDRITIVSLDLVEHGRVKAYVVMPDASIDELPSAARDFARHMLGGDRRTWWLVAHDLTAGTSAAHFAARQLDAPTMRERTRELCGVDRDDLHYVSFQHRDGAPRITTYFTPRVHR